MVEVQVQRNNSLGKDVRNGKAWTDDTARCTPRSSTASADRSSPPGHRQAARRACQYGNPRTGASAASHRAPAPATVGSRPLDVERALGRDRGEIGHSAGTPWAARWWSASRALAAANAARVWDVRADRRAGVPRGWRAAWVARLRADPRREVERSSKSQPPGAPGDPAREPPALGPAPDIWRAPILARHSGVQAPQCGDLLDQRLRSIHWDLLAENVKLLIR